ncbi:16S rRNA (uracil(1498)-N(3))-methyltransferase [Portibacter lacus]|uniref:Ribosomal RNA small subunit methyltransferase E n=1 Tax=Portibacter lacus TaxID=1099794 RepID=A0AA37SQ74_9BACT|nr:16S rRNA (uracil(1498)-N(3))-methyltransferase [Portibacter lacus]GLR17274.1 ribosomal RNA small subunit methyltransferase E [Portibacter lacus]
MILFYSEKIDGETAILTDGEAIHCKQALRKKVGEIIIVTDGKGKTYEAEITSIGKKEVELKLLKEVPLSAKRDFRIHIAIAPTKNISRFEWFLEKATELGIDEITPILCARSERKVIKSERLNKILLSAMKQSLKSELPKLNELTKLSAFLKKDFEGQCFIAHLEEEPELLVKSYQQGSDVLILIGPEGDFMLEEIEMAKQSGFESVSLGDYRLRTETAGISSVQAIHFCNMVG